MTYHDYLSKALQTALEDEANGADRWNLDEFNRLCRAGVKENWRRLNVTNFLIEYLWCVASVRKDADVHREFEADQIELFRGCNPKRIVNEADLIVKEWESKKSYLNARQVKAMIMVSGEIVKLGWPAFKRKKLLIPENPESQDPNDWTEPVMTLRGFYLIGEALAYYLTRNLYGAPFFKPDQHIMEVAGHFFGYQRDSILAMTEATKWCWPSICTDTRFLPVHIGEVDLILWQYKRDYGIV